MKTAPDAYGVWRPVEEEERYPVLASGKLNADDGDFGAHDGHGAAGETHSTASNLRKVIYVGLLVIFGSAMTLLISAQDRYCIHQCPGRNETYKDQAVVPLCSAFHQWTLDWEASCKDGSLESNTPAPPTAPTTWQWLTGQSASSGSPVYFVSSKSAYSINAVESGQCNVTLCSSLDPNEVVFPGTNPDEPYPSDNYTVYQECNANCCTSEVFHQPFVQLFQMGCGQVLTGLFFPFYRHSPEPGHSQMGDPTFRQFAPKAALASLFDALAEVFIILGLGLTAPATAEMMKATLVIFTGVLSTWFFKDFRLSRKQWIATAVMLCGAALVIAQEYIFPEECNYGASKRGPLEEVVGALFTIIAQIFYALQFITEESLIDENKVRHLHVNKALLVFCEGWVSILAAVLLQVPFTYVADPKDRWSGFTEDVATYFSDPVLWGLGIALSASVAGFDIWGLLTAEHMGSDNRAVVCASFQVVLVWTVSLTVPYFEETFNWVALVGFIIILAAGLFYSYTAIPKEDPRTKEKERLLREGSSS
jgi:drug/metabolite transporter (DMT)-like permease